MIQDQERDIEYGLDAEVQFFPFTFLLAITLMRYLVFFFILVNVKVFEVVVITFLRELLPGY